jgi:extracellular elastinolytic metalloproteinase
VNHIPENKFTANDFVIYPNPADEQIFISSKRIAPNITLRIMDITGNILQMSRIIDRFPGEVTIDISSVKTGFYIIHLFSEGFSETHKIYISR